MTRNGYQTLKAELEKLKSVERPASIKAIEVARAHGDLSENAEYDAAKADYDAASAQLKALLAIFLK